MARTSRHLAIAWLGIAAVLIAGLYPRFAAGDRPLKLTDWFLFHQDMNVLWAIAAAALAALTMSFGPAVPARLKLLPSLGQRGALALAAVMALASLAIAWAGTFLVYDGYALSLDEFMANFDARILAHGQLMAPIQPAWRELVTSLQPTFVTVAPGEAAWSSQYLPVNAALRALGIIAGAPSLVSPLLAGVSVMAVFGVARRLWPERPGLALAAAALLASSSQFLITAMTAYAMTAHLALNLVWLWLFLRGGRLGHAGAILVGFLATGLHQFIFHPLFVAPFVAQLLLERRWRLALIYACAYALICAFWIGYWRIAFALLGQAASPSVMGAAAIDDLATRITPLLTALNADALRAMDANVIRFATWQSLLTVPLAVIGAGASIRAGGTVRALALGLVLAFAAMFFILPHQGHGWGYRYWHGLLGSACLLAVFGWARLTQKLDEGARGGALFAGIAAASLLVLFPLRAWQVHTFEHPYALAWAAVARAPTDVVIVDPAGAWYAADLVRNDPYLRRRPLVFDIHQLSDEQLAALCARSRASLFDAGDAIRNGVRASKTTTDRSDPDDAIPGLVRFHAAGCGA